MDTKQLKQILEDNFFYSEKEGLEIIIKKIEEMTSEIREALEKYLLTEELTEINREGYTIEILIKEHNMKPIAAYLTLDYLERNPEKAKKSLKKGYDLVK